MELIRPVSHSRDAALKPVAESILGRIESARPAAPSAPRRERLFALDFLRGADIFFLTVLSGLIWASTEVCTVPRWLLEQLEHPDWVGFSLYDMIMPLFIFMCGAALPLALPRRLNSHGEAGWDYWKHVFGRVAMLWILGMIAQGELFSFDFRRISFFNNTLQTIAVGYLFTAVVALVPSRAIRILTPFLLAAGYTVFLHLGGDFTPTGNAAVVYEVKFLSLFYPNALWHPVAQISEWHYTWWTTVPMFAVMGLAGYHATKILMVESWSKINRAAVQATIGGLLIALGFVLMTFDPCIKHIFTASFTALAMGISFVLYALCYLVFDIFGIRRGTGLISLFGRHSLLAYMFAETCFKSVLVALPAAVLPGLSRFMTIGQRKFVAVFLECVALIIVLYVWDGFRRKRVERTKEAK